MRKGICSQYDDSTGEPMAKKSVKRASSKDVAREAGVSQSTVSRVFNNSGIPVSEDKRQLILETAARMGYRPSLIARSLNQQRTHIIGLLVKNFSNIFYIEALRLFSLMFQKQGYTIMLFNTQDDGRIEEDLVKALEYQVDGVVLTSATLDSSIVTQYKDFGVPVILFNRLNEGKAVNAVCCDNVAGGEAVARYLIERGHRNLVYIAGEEGSSTNRDRQNGFIRQSGEMGISDIRIIDGDFSYQSGYRAAEQLIAQCTSFDGVFCPSDSMAIGFMDYISMHTQLSIPEDFSLVGFDGAPIQNEELYPLTTYEQPLQRMVEKTVQFMIDTIENYTPEPVSYLFNGSILERGTVRDRR